MRMARQFTLQQFLTRENFRHRWDRGEAVYLHETFYAILQGYDAHILQADVQVGGSDQLYNIVTASRKLMPLLGGRANVAVILGILPGTDGSQKMSKSAGNSIPLMAAPGEMYGKVMSIPDHAMARYFRLVTRLDPDQISQIEADLGSGVLHPRDAKMRLAREIVAVFHGDEASEQAEGAFVKVFREKSLPADMPEFSLSADKPVLDILVESRLVPSRSEGRRLILQKAVRLNGEPVGDGNEKAAAPCVLQVGKRRFLSVVPAPRRREKD
jgi:tyrosyl-tRNA synthetase